MSSGSIQNRQKAPKDASSSVSDSGESTESDLESVDVEKEMNNAGESVNAVSADTDKDRKRQKDNEKYFGLSDTEREKDVSNRDGESALVDEFMEEVVFWFLGFVFLLFFSFLKLLC